MSKKKQIGLVCSITVVICAIILLLVLFIPGKSYSQGYCLNDQITNGMSLNEIAEVYSDGCVSVIVESSLKDGRKMTTLGSGVCIASNGYSTGSGYIASKGSYYVTNYHVISNAVDEFYKGYTTKIEIEKDDSTQRYDAQLLWADKNFDVAVIYSDDTSSGYVLMEDRVVNPTEENKLGYDEIFTIGTPLSLNYKNNFTKGNISNKNTHLVETTEETLYSYIYDGQQHITTDVNSAPSSSKEYSVCENVYENTVLMNCDITNGNSGGGVFDGNGKLIGLSTLGVDTDQANTASLNFLVPIYPVMQVLDRLIYSNENGGSSGIVDFDNMGWAFLDGEEGYYHSKTRIEFSSYYKDGQLFPLSTYAGVFNFRDEGVVILDSSIGNLARGDVIKSVQIDGVRHTIKTRNDLKFLLLSCNKGDQIGLVKSLALGLTNTVTITL